MIHSSVTGYDVVCDGHRCSEFLEVESVDHVWRELMDQMREAGWRSVREGGVWCHFCPDCVEKRDERDQKLTQLTEQRALRRSVDAYRRVWAHDDKSG